MNEIFFADILLPLPLKGYFTYRIPRELVQQIQFGIRVIVPFGKNKLYSGLVVRIHEEVPKQLNVKYILDIIDNKAVISEKQFTFWQWLAAYYLCNMGDVMAAALPSALKMTGETKVMLSDLFDGNISDLNEKEILILEILASHQVMSVDELSKAVNIKKIIPFVKTLVEKNILLTDEEIRNPYKPKKEIQLSLHPSYQNEQNFLTLIQNLEKSAKNAKQVDLLLGFMMMLQENNCQQIAQKEMNYALGILQKDLLDKSKVTLSRLNTLIQKEILVRKEVVISRLASYNSIAEIADIQFSPAQQTALQKIKQQFENKEVVLLHGVTGSGKTELYIQLIQDTLSQGKQVLYLLPEIALTTQIVNRLRKYFGDKVGVYHSRFNEFERVEIWNRVLSFNATKEDEGKYQLILGARSALLLPFSKLGLIIVDEEHDASFKQLDPAPRYHARDGAVVLGNIHQAKVLLGSATPSLESYYNTKQEKYGLVELKERFTGSTLPEIWLVNIKESRKQKKMQEFFSQFLLDHIAEALEKEEQVIIFQNRRGFALQFVCNSCQSIPSCKYCDVSLTYHKKSHLLKCHYCGYAIELPKQCPQCHSNDVEVRGFGTEKVEEYLQEYFPKVRIARLDLDTTRSKTAYQNIIADFENRETDILVGTQMVTKGLDFDRVSVVGILNADHLITFPDFRSFERAFQIISQVSGRAGRKNIPGKVIIQTHQPQHPALQYVLTNDYPAMYNHQIAERHQYVYPPFCRLIKLIIKHKDEEIVNKAAAELAVCLRQNFPRQVLGPEFPLVARIQNLYLKDIWLKMPKNQQLEKQKQHLQNLLDTFMQNTSYKNVRIIVNVDA